MNPAAFQATAITVACTLPEGTRGITEASIEIGKERCLLKITLLCNTMDGTLDYYIITCDFQRQHVSNS